MRFSSIFLAITALAAAAVSYSEAGEEAAFKPFEIKSKGFELVMNSIRSLAYGGETGDNIYKDLFINTVNDFYVTLENSNDQITVDDILRIFIQSVIILSTNRRADLVPSDFHEKNEEFKEFILELNSILDLLSKKGTNAVTLGSMRRMFTTLRKEKFWDAVVELNGLVKLNIEKEAEKDRQKLEASLEAEKDGDGDNDDDDDDDDAEDGGKSKKETKAEL